VSGASKESIESISMFLAGSPRQNVVVSGLEMKGSQKRSMLEGTSGGGGG